jgi:hypothetical protein
MNNRVPAIYSIMRDNAESCFDSDGQFDPPQWLCEKCWPVIAKAVPDFFNDAYNGDEEFERTLLAAVHLKTLPEITLAFARANELFCKSARWYMSHYADDVLAYLVQP